jgi:AcrR family transcriptional regulator
MKHPDAGRPDPPSPPASSAEVVVDENLARTALGTAARDALPLVQERRGTTIRDTEGVARRLSAAAIELFDAHGFDNVTVADIAERAGVTRRTFFRYFSNKETIVLDIWDQTNQDLVQTIVTVAAEQTVFSVLREAITTWIDENQALLQGLAAMADRSRPLSSATLHHASAWEEHIAEALLVRLPDLDPALAEMAGVIAMGVMRVAHRRVLSGGTGFAPEVDRLFQALTSYQRSTL